MTGLLALLRGLGIAPETPLVTVIEILITTAAVYYIRTKAKTQ
jgi:hypothetical protein